MAMSSTAIAANMPYATYIASTVEPDRGKRTFPAYQRRAPDAYNFMQDEFLEHRHQHDARHARDDEVPLKFRGGFHRRTDDTMGTIAARRERIQAKEAKAEIHHHIRQDMLRTKHNTNGNVLVGGDAITAPERAEGLKANLPVSDWAIRDEKVRTRAGDARFYDPVDKAVAMHRTATLLKQQAAQKASIIGWGRNDTLSLGVADNFIGHGLHHTTAFDGLAPPPPRRKSTQPW